LWSEVPLPLPFSFGGVRRRPFASGDTQICKQEGLM
jgi:hypothetical protein